MKAIRRNLMVLLLSAACNIGTGIAFQQGVVPNKVRKNKVSIPDVEVTPVMLSAMNARIAKANLIARQIRDTSDGMTEASYVNLSQALLGASDAGLAGAASARSYKSAMALIRSSSDNAGERRAKPGNRRTAGFDNEASPAEFQTKALGTSINTEFVFYPIVPCRLLDTRAYGIRLTPGVPYQVDFDGGNSGNALGCTYTGIASQLGNSLWALDRAALIINLTVTGSSIGGWIRAQPVGSASFFSNQNFLAGQNLANMVIVQDAGTVAEFELVASEATHAVVDVLGGLLHRPQRLLIASMLSVMDTD